MPSRERREGNGTCKGLEDRDGSGGKEGRQHQGDLGLVEGCISARAVATSGDWLRGGGNQSP